jgi:phosphoribosylglycinamide formyltransferase-1
MSERTRFGVLLSGSGTNLQALIDAANTQHHPAEIAVVISNRKDAFGLERARQAGIPAVHVPHKGKDRAVFDQELVDVLVAHDVEWVALAGFMRILTPTFLSAFHNRVLNIHPALLPAFPGTNGQGQAFESGVRIAGATVHLVDSGTDTGPIVAQGAVPVLETDTAETLQQRILRVEHVLFPKVFRWAAEGRVSVSDGRAVVTLPDGEERFCWQG